MYPEGGLSRDGSLGPARLGLLDYMLRGFDPDDHADVVFVPVGINYDRVLEDRTLLREGDATAERRSPLAALVTTLEFWWHQLWLRLRGGWFSFGYACVNFGRPLSAREFFDERGVDPRRLDRETRFERVGELADELMGRVASIIPVLPVSLVCEVLLGDLERTWTELELKAAVQARLVELRSRGRRRLHPSREPRLCGAGRVADARPAPRREPGGRYLPGERQRPRAPALLRERDRSLGEPARRGGARRGGVKTVRRLGLILAGLVAVTVVAGWWLFSRARSALPRVDGEISSWGLEGPVSVARDDLGIPIIRAQSFEDAVQAQGFVHAQDRYFQMDLSRRATAGELALLFGERALEADEHIRRRQRRQAAFELLSAMDPDARRMIEAYTLGVNAGLSGLAQVPPEYQILRVRPLPWLLEDTVLAALGFFDTLSFNHRMEKPLGVMVATLPEPLFDFLDAVDEPLGRSVDRPRWRWIRSGRDPRTRSRRPPQRRDPRPRRRSTFAPSEWRWARTAGPSPGGAVRTAPRFWPTTRIYP